MNLVLIWFIIYLSLSTEVLANVQFHALQAPGGYFRDRVARRVPQKGQRHRFNTPQTTPKQRPDPALTYRFPGRLSSSENISPFTASPSNRRYHEDKHILADNRNVISHKFPHHSESDKAHDRFAGNRNVISHKFPRHSKSDKAYYRFADKQNVISHKFPHQFESDEGYDGFASDTNPEDQIFENPQQIGEETESKGDETGASDFEKEYLSAELDPENVKTPVTNDRNNEFDKRLFALVLSAITAVMVAVIAIVIIHNRLKKRSKASEVVAYGDCCPRMKRVQKDDKRLRHAAQVYHFQHQKRRMLAVSSSNGRTSETETEEGSELDTSLFEPHEGELMDTQLRDHPTPESSAGTPEAVATGSAV
jgi:hypothetical protein